MSGADAYREALRLDALGRYGEAQKLCQQLLKAAPDHADIHHLLGVIFIHAGRHEDAVRHLKQALKLKPDLTEAASNLAKAYTRKGKWREVIAALHQTPDTSGKLIDVGFAQEQLDEVDAAAGSYRGALRLDPASGIAHSNLGALLTKQGKLAEAEEHLSRALAAAPAPPTALLNMAMLHEAAGRHDDVVKAYDRVLEGEPDHAAAHFQRAMALLSQGRFAEGWQEYHWRFRRPEARTSHAAFALPFWNGESLAGRSLLIWTEQGPGDEILLASMIPDVLKQGASVTLVCSPRLAPLFRRSFPDCRVISTERMHRPDSGVNGCEFQASFSHLGAGLRPSFESFPSRTSFLRADENQRQKLRASYQNGNPARHLIGLAWHSANPTAERQKSIPLDAWAPILQRRDVTFVSLQYGDHTAGIAAARAAFRCDIVTDPSIDSLKDIDAFAAQVAAMDHVVSVSNTTVHVAGSLGIPTSVLIPKAFGKIWYWFQDRSDSPWYPSLRLFRQRTHDDWAETVAAVARSLP